jgi:CRISPR-associated protein Csb1
MKLSLDTINTLMSDRAVRGLSITRELQPLGGEGDFVAPPTFAQDKGEEKGPRYVRSTRRVDDRMVDVFLLDSPASQANRMEQSVLSLVDDDLLSLPLYRLDVPGLGVLTDLELPHRVFDAAIGTSMMKGTTYKWKDSDNAKEIRSANKKDATALLRHSPMLLVMGGWDSHSGTAANAWGGRYEKAAWSKVVAVDAHTMANPGGRLDPMGLPSSEKVDLGSGSKKLVDQGLGVVPASMGKHPHLRVSMAMAEQRSVISFGVFRTLSFGTPQQDLAARVYLATLSLLCLTAMHRDGGHLRSECDLVCANAPGWQIRTDHGADQLLAGVNVDTVLDLVNDAAIALAGTGITLRDGDIELDVHPAIAAALCRDEA